MSKTQITNSHVKIWFRVLDTPQSIAKTTKSKRSIIRSIHIKGSGDKKNKRTEKKSLGITKDYKVDKKTRPKKKLQQQQSKDMSFEL